MKKITWGKHLIIDMDGCNAKTNNESDIIVFNKMLVEKLNMVGVGDPYIKRTGTSDALKGWSCVQFIETSNITGHYNDARDVYLDVFSCQDFTESEVADFVIEFFEPKSIQTTTIYRDAKIDPILPIEKYRK